MDRNLRDPLRLPYHQTAVHLPHLQGFMQQAGKLGEYIGPTVNYEPDFTVTQARLRELAAARMSEYQKLDS